MKYLISLFRNGRTKTLTVEAASSKRAEAIVKKKYPHNEIIRISSEQHEIDYFNLMKERKRKLK
tara:strand:- start:8975 stop:9166 length:192 start_codon:yes stop_codon:yes gene_type:complete